MYTLSPITSSMGSLPSPPSASASAPPPSPETTPLRYRVYASFCLREPAPNINISNWIDCYNPYINAWNRVTSIPNLEENHVLKDFAMISIGDTIYIIGGRRCRKERAHITDELADIVDMNVEVLTSVLRYNIHSDQWSSCAPLNVPRYDFACSMCDNKIYVAGGQSTLKGARGITAAEMYDPSFNEWTLLPDMSTLRYKCVGVTWQEKVHVLDVPPNQIVAVGGRLFSSGDCLNAWKGHIEAYDGKLKLWYIVDGSQLQILSSPVSTSYGNDDNWPPIQRLYLTMAPIGTLLYFLAGYRKAGESSRTVSMVDIFDTSASRDAWMSAEPTEEEGEKELCSHCCVVQLAQDF
ncbi:hypothetical protein F0562_014071 [Nyssa sinensis]|uniref:F-box domain-containing protein n=1 Tax=Nyssa sinensis TaxID=561372 RepID=A0A5J4ZPD8_9ASTE|nr:hypothetical protein F0562_014071 [Nyssa sinensis]